MTDRQKEWEVVQAMKHYGGGFVKALANAWFHADEDNQRRIREAWPEYWGEYDSMAEMMRNQDGKDWWDK